MRDFSWSDLILQVAADTVFPNKIAYQDDEVLMSLGNVGTGLGQGAGRRRRGFATADSGASPGRACADRPRHGRPQRYCAARGARAAVSL